MNASRFVVTALLVGASTTLVFGCNLKKAKKTSESDDPPVSNAPTVKVTGSGAKNEANVLRYATETKLADEPATIGKDAKVREFPQTGKEIVTLGAGTPVTKIAQYFSSGVLVTFVDPSTSDGSKLMGWIEPSTLAAAPVAVTTPATPVAPVATQPKPVATDAGAKPVDAGASPTPTSTADAGGGASPSQTPLLLTQPGAGNKCPAGMTLMGPFCRRACTSQAQCPANTFCSVVQGGKACTATK